MHPPSIDVLAMFSKQWPDATEFGQDLLDFFIKDIEGAMVDPKITDKSKIGSVSSLMRYICVAQFVSLFVSFVRTKQFSLVLLRQLL